MSTIQEELRKLGNLGEAFIHAVLPFISALEPGEFRKGSAEWVYYPRNFVALAISTRKGHVILTLRGWLEFANFEHLPESGARSGSYTRFTVKEIGQMDATLFHLRRAYELSKRGRRRKWTKIKIVEENPRSA